MRQLSWRKVNGEAIWHGKPGTVHKLPPLRLEVIAGIRNSSVINRSALLRVQLPIGGRKYSTVCEQQFYSSWHAKLVVDALFMLCANKNTIDPQVNYEWFVNELRSFKTPEVEPPATYSWAKVAGYPC